MVVLISGVSLAGYVAWRLAPDARGLLLTGLLGGVVSSTATAVVYACHARATLPAAQALVVIALANCAMFARVLLIVVVVAPRARSAQLHLRPGLGGRAHALRRAALRSRGHGLRARVPRRLDTDMRLHQVLGHVAPGDPFASCTANHVALPSREMRRR
jgi:hypothetical protein